MKWIKTKPETTTKDREGRPIQEQHIIKLELIGNISIREREGKAQSVWFESDDSKQTFIYSLNEPPVKLFTKTLTEFLEGADNTVFDLVYWQKK